MNAEIETIGAVVSRSSRLIPHPAPSLRVPVTANNRDLLRWLRAAELSAWKAGHAFSHKCFSLNSVASGNNHVQNHNNQTL